MKCKHIRKMLADYANQVLESGDNQMIQKHISECQSCRHELDVMRNMLRLIDTAKVEYPPAQVWENLIPDLHKRIEREAALAFEKHQKQRFYLLPGWTMSVVTIILLIFASVLLWHYPLSGPTELAKQENIKAAERTSLGSLAESDTLEYSSESMLVAGLISSVLITESEAAELEKLKNYNQSEILTPSHYYYYEGILAEMIREARDAKNDEDVIHSLLNNEFTEFIENPVIESSGSEFGTM